MGNDVRAKERIIILFKFTVKISCIRVLFLIISNFLTNIMF